MPGSGFLTCKVWWPGCSPCRGSGPFSFPVFSSCNISFDPVYSFFLFFFFVNSDCTGSSLCVVREPFFLFPFGDATFRQRAWDHLRAEGLANHLLENACDDEDRVRLLATTCKESGAWLNALSISSAGLRLDDDSFRIAIGLRLGSSICSSHVCRHCNEPVGNLRRHGFSCRWSEGRLYRHAALNGRSLTSIHVPALLEPSGLSRSDGKCFDGITITPWSSGKPLVWDATCPDTFAPSHRCLAVHMASKIADKAEAIELQKYSNLLSSRIFTLVAINYEEDAVVSILVSDEWSQLMIKRRMVNNASEQLMYWCAC